MTWFIVGIVFFTLVIIAGFIVLKKLSYEEKNYMEVSDIYLSNIGKDYNKETYASWAASIYIEIINSVMNENYEFLRDILSDEIYNNYLISIKNAKDKNIKNIVENMNPIFSKLVNLKIQNDMEIAKVWMKLSYIEYTKDLTPLMEGQEEKDKIISGSKTNTKEKEYILTFVKQHMPKESMVCPNCGYVSNIVYRSKCERCGANVVHKQHHWVLIGKEEKR